MEKLNTMIDPALAEKTLPKKKKKPAKLSRTRRPEDMSIEEWQLALRRQFGREQKFKFKKLGPQPAGQLFRDYEVTNPASQRTYRVAIRGEKLGESFCSCPDFATNTLGTCKHVEFLLERLRHQPGGKRGLSAGFRPVYSEIYLQYGAERQVKLRSGTSCPAEVRRIFARYFDADGLLQREAFEAFEQLLSETGRKGHELRCHEDVLRFIAEVRDSAQRRRIIDKAFPLGEADPALDKLVNVQLYDYQKKGALFAARAGRCLIGDEMGLGKTVQAIAAAEIMARHIGVERVLIICPTSLKHQWEREIARFTSRTAVVIGGLRASREACFAQPGFFKITNYDTVHRDLDLIQQWRPDLVILDEAQRIKNWSTRAARNVKQIQSPSAIVLTGTPLENRLEELVSIVQFVDQHRLGPTFRFLADHQIHDEVGKVIGYRNLDSIGKTLAPILLRRQKSQVLKQLPARIDKNFFVPMTAQQLNHHNENKENVARLVLKWRRFGFLSEADQLRLRIALQNMRMSCDSTYLLDHESDFGVKSDEIATLLGEIFEEQSAKAVIFSQWLRMHELLQRRFEKRKWSHVLFHGSLDGAERKAMIDRFREDPNCRAFLSTDAGGVGLNLQHASVVVNVDLPWNPAVLEQRIGRVHRLGQSRPVQVFNFVAQGTIEQGMLGLLKFKKSLFAGALDGGDPEIRLGGTQLSRFIKTVEQATSDIPAASVEDPADARDAANTEPDDKAPSASSRPPADAPSNPALVSAAGATDPWAGLLQTGLSILEQLASASRGGPAAPATSPGGVSIVQRDERTGESYLRLPMPNPQTMDRLLGAVSALLEKFRPR